jgi:hypothetical protein
LLDVIEPGLDLPEHGVGVRAVYRYGREHLAVSIGHYGERHAGLEAEGVRYARGEIPAGSSVQLERHLPRLSRPESRAPRCEPLAKPIADRACGMEQHHHHLAALPPRRGTALRAFVTHDEQRDSPVGQHRR